VPARRSKRPRTRPTTRCWAANPTKVCQQSVLRTLDNLRHYRVTSASPSQLFA
jgi:hypothetical protein